MPFKYRDKSFVNALQWAIGLELFLLVNDPWRLFLRPTIQTAVRSPGIRTSFAC
ncbi:hypothetical protein [Bradyrhizobium sp. RDI18]|uniref:hypothetical protein n=1 Tax=Bradyrhizobium sp. RDI18 TaxID=3367400 RepID=UPI0037111E4B